MSRLSWAESVRRGRKLADAERANKWAIADLALATFPLMDSAESAPYGDPEIGVELPRAKIKRWLAETGLEMEVPTLRQYRRTAAAFPPNQRQRHVAFSTHTRLAARPELLRPGMTQAEASELEIKVVRPDWDRLLRSLESSTGFLRTAQRAIPNRRLTVAQQEALGEHIAQLEAELDALLERVGMAEPEPLKAVA